MGKLAEIYAGWKNHIFRNPEVEKLAKKRAKICVDCKQITKINTCKICGCYISAKVRSPISKCPLRYW